MIGGMLRNVLSLCGLCGMCRRNVGNAKRLSCSASGGGWGTATPFTQAGGVCVYIESAPHPDWLNKAPHAGTRNKRLK